MKNHEYSLNEILKKVAAIKEIDFNNTYTPSFINSLNKILLLMTY